MNELMIALSKSRLDESQKGETEKVADGTQEVNQRYVTNERRGQVFASSFFFEIDRVQFHCPIPSNELHERHCE